MTKIKRRNLFINPTSCFVVGGLMGDCGLTGCKIIAEPLIFDLQVLFKMLDLPWEKTDKAAALRAEI